MAYSINLNNKQLNLGNESRAGYPYATFYLIKLVKLFCRFPLLSNFELKLGELVCRSPLLDDYSELKLRKLFCRLALA
jgi:hypothetical protein